MTFVISEEKIKDATKNLNMNYINRFYDYEKCHTYVNIICEKHSYKGIQTLDVDRLFRWEKKGECMCTLWNRDTEDLKRDSGLNPNVEIVGQYVKSNIKIACKCKKCNFTWSATPNKLQQGKGCPECGKIRVTHDEFVNRIKQSQPFIQITGQYTNMDASISYKCTICGRDGVASAKSLLELKSSCRYCKASIGEKKVAAWLIDNRIPFETEKTFEKCECKGPLRFDFYIQSKNTCIEFQGQQHYNSSFYTKFTKTSQEEYLEIQKKHDAIKRQYCLDNNIDLIEIPYWDINDIDKHLNKLID